MQILPNDVVDMETTHIYDETVPIIVIQVIASVSSPTAIGYIAISLIDVDAELEEELVSDW